MISFAWWKLKTIQELNRMRSEAFECDVNVKNVDHVWWQQQLSIEHKVGKKTHVNNEKENKMFICRSHIFGECTRAYTRDSRSLSPVQIAFVDVVIILNDYAIAVYLFVCDGHRHCIFLHLTNN